MKIHSNSPARTHVRKSGGEDPKAGEGDSVHLGGVVGRAILGAGLGCIPLVGGMTTALGGCLSGERFGDKHGNVDAPGPKLLGTLAGGLVGIPLNLVGLADCVAKRSVLPMLPSALAGALFWAYSGTSD